MSQNLSGKNRRQPRTAPDAAPPPALRERESAVAAREGTATRRELAAAAREAAAGLREEASALREEAVRAREEAANVRATLEELMTQMREVNERLVVATVHAQTMAEAAERANRLKDEFLATVSHELRTPLNAILGWARLLTSTQLPPDRATHGIATIERNALALTHIIDDLLDVSRTVAGNFQIEAQPIDLIAIVDASIDGVRPLAEARNVELACSPGPRSADVVLGDAGRLEQVFWNLLANAIKFTPAGGRVDVFIEPTDEYMEIRVVDTGQGISAEFLPHVFERFRQADGTTTRRHTGLGLGLAIVRQLVALHGGTVQATSEGTGRGATFSVRLPIAVGETNSVRTMTADDPVGPAAAAAPGLPRLDKLRILVVDDNADGRTLTSLMLTQAGATVKAVATVRDALQAIQMERPDALVSDIGLPDKDGYALIRQIRQDEVALSGALPALALTGYTRAEDRTRVLAAGFQAYLSKPVNPAQLTAAIATITGHLPDR